jgi:hypothetical protein
VNKSNAQHAILFEAISYILALDFSKDLLASSVASLGRFLSVKVRCWRARVCMKACRSGWPDPPRCKVVVRGMLSSQHMRVLACACVRDAQEPNIRYLALENLTRLALVPEVLESIAAHQVRTQHEVAAPLPR